MRGGAWFSGGLRSWSLRVPYPMRPHVVSMIKSPETNRETVKIWGGESICCGSRLRKGEVFAYVGLPQCWAPSVFRTAHPASGMQVLCIYSFIPPHLFSFCPVFIYLSVRSAGRVQATFRQLPSLPALHVVLPTPHVVLPTPHVVLPTLHAVLLNPAP